MSEIQDLNVPASPRRAPGPPDLARLFAGSPIPMLVMAADAPRFTMVLVNKAHASAFGTTPEALTGYGIFEVFPDPPSPVAAAFMETVRRSLERTMASGRADQMPVQPYAVTTPAGDTEERFWSATQTPIFDAKGRVTHILSTVRDVTSEVKERQATEARALLMREVDHRARNALTVVQAIVRLTSARSLDAFKQVVLGRVEALARAQSSLARRKWEGAFLQDVIEAELAAIAKPGAWRVSGPTTLVAPEKVQAFSMIVHELATNAAKYGALSASSGIVEVSWRMASPNGLALTWREHGVPAPERPQRAGFGSRLMRQLARQLGGAIRHDWRPDGLCVELTAAL